MTIDNGLIAPPEIQKMERPEKITVDDLQFIVPELEGTAIALQCNVKDNRDPKSPLEMGALVPEKAEQCRIRTKEDLERVLSELTPEELSQIDFLVVAADTKLDTPIPGVKSEHKRAVETGQLVIDAIREVMEKLHIDPKQLLNKTGAPLELTEGALRDCRMFEDSPEFVEFLKNKYPDINELWKHYEMDTDREVRVNMGAEGLQDIADRVTGYLQVLMNAMQQYHQYHPGRRVMAWAEGHYDCISPSLKRDVVGMEMDRWLPVDKAGGIVIDVKPDQTASTVISGQRFAVPRLARAAQ